MTFYQVRVEVDALPLVVAHRPLRDTLASLAGHSAYLLSARGEQSRSAKRLVSERSKCGREGGPFLTFLTKRRGERPPLRRSREDPQEPLRGALSLTAFSIRATPGSEEGLRNILVWRDESLQRKLARYAFNSRFAIQSVSSLLLCRVW